MTHAATFAFGDYLFIPRRQLLLKNGVAVRVGCRALDLLAAFVRRPGEVLSKRELMEEAWPCTTVIEGNLKVHVAALRRVFDDDAELAQYIATVNGRGYRFVAPVSCSEAPTASASPWPLVGEVQPAPARALDGRFQDMIALLTQAMRSVVIDLPGESGAGMAPTVSRRVLCIELTACDEAWIEGVFAQPQRAMSMTR
ncbi:winged helix-turn-helix domain-containing protein [Nitrospirillum iridis]|uniref:DNA-binding winged helix-turn-helix (WHTH) protein n=1 Tax=Nitrospirillum iridis TaxID=765888 RepID=A0A7X0EGS3_9PROT|nr:transcriptional regulator [Nitrospirillum iridis]MBB6254401.1 DNA-binding winged helix-turn-helix (wHTH) protein [Nitrospirillum iridis]